MSTNMDLTVIEMVRIAHKILDKYEAVNITKQNGEVSFSVISRYTPKNAFRATIDTRRNDRQAKGVLSSIRAYFGLSQ